MRETINTPALPTPTVIGTVASLQDDQVEIAKVSGYIRVTIKDEADSVGTTCFLTPEQAERLVSMIKRAALPAVL